MTARIRELWLLGCTSLSSLHNCVIFCHIYSCRVEALLQTRANLELFVSVLERGDGNYGLGFMGRPGPPGPKGMSPLQL